MKTCPRCGVSKPPTEFNRDKYAKDGLRSQCKACMTIERQRLQAHYKAWREDPDRKARYRAYRIETYDPVKTKARNLVNRAIRRGELVRQPCEACGATPTEGHHDDYSKPLVVRWLCRACHDKHHEEHTP